MACNDKQGVFEPITLPCGRTVALYEHLAHLFGGPPNRHHLSLYSQWAAFEWGMVITGNVNISPHHLTLARDLVLPSQHDAAGAEAFRALAKVMRGNGNRLAIMQLNHAGRQSPNVLGGRTPFAPPLGPSSIRVGSEHPATTDSQRMPTKGMLASLINWLMFQFPREMSLDDIDKVVDEFVRGAKLAVDTGFDGVELHAAHGYLLAQFMSSKSNQRTDNYSAQGLKLLHRIADGIRMSVPSDFVLGIKINSADYSSNETTLVFEHFRTIASWGLFDFIEISGGDYENPGPALFTYHRHLSQCSPRTDFITSRLSSRQATFATFSQSAMQIVEGLPKPPLILLTGGLNSPNLLHSVLSSHHAHLLGIGRSAVLRPDIPEILRACSDWQSNELFARDPDLQAGTLRRVFDLLPPIKLIGAGVKMAWYTIGMRRLVGLLQESKCRLRGFPPVDYSAGALRSVIVMWAWFQPELDVIAPNIHRFWLRVIAMIAIGIMLAAAVSLPRPPGLYHHSTPNTFLFLEMLSVRSLIAACLFLRTFAAPTPEPWKNAPTKCDLTAVEMNLPANQTALLAPMRPPHFVALGLGFQNYTCNPSTSAYSSIGAVALLFDISCMDKAPASTSIQQSAFDAWSRAAPTITLQAVLASVGTNALLGSHYFVPSPTGTGISPEWDFSVPSHNTSAIVIGTKVGDIPAPNNSTANVDWLAVNGVQGSLASQVFRIDTVGGQPPTSCAAGSANISVKYTAKYFLY
ncbi:unnamed protein product [Mycena citricolor]|uniref:NADH:flavin oxidoreductase/NADH oxidase N-terminal domain-containing protein n=1 Tax=Mycena citricolor TaxID=2018698 RepID=A0AAD2GTQ3_9AGAR|nr:unnamed protein product [Mycena citricolor]